MKPRELALVGLVLFGCAGTPLPPDRQAYAGHWRGAATTLTIRTEGSLSYERITRTAETSVNAPLVGFSGNDLVAGVACMRTTLKVTAPPHLVGGAWKMTVEDEELTRAP